MGLCNEERRTGIYWGLHRIDKIVEDWKHRRKVYDFYVNDNVERVFELVDQLWPAFLGGISNSIHWIFGSSSSNTVTDQLNTPWEVAIEHFCSDAYEEFHKDENCIKWRSDNPDRPYNAVEDTNIADLLKSKDHWPEAYVFEIYQEVEQLIYYLRRYNDKFLQGYVDLNTLVSKISGACFNVFAVNEKYAKAYLIHQML